MLSVANVRSAGGAASYFAKDNYYTSADADRSGMWVGKGAERLGLTGIIRLRSAIIPLVKISSVAKTDGDLVLPGLTRNEGPQVLGDDAPEAKTARGVSDDMLEQNTHRLYLRHVPWRG